MARPKKETKEEVCEVTQPNINSDFAKLLDIYKAKNPKKYELKKAELLKKLELNK